MKTDCLDYRELPGQNGLFLRYLYDFDRMKSWYPAGPPDPDLLKRRALRLLSSGRSFPRDLLAERLEYFNRSIGSGERALENISRLRQAETVAVVTGQQVGFLGGPALAVYKAVTAIWLAELLSEEGTPAVPVFWLASDDSDFEEVASAVMLDQEGRLLRVQYPAPSEQNRMAGTVRLDSIRPIFDELERSVVCGEFRRQVLDSLQEAYQPGRTFGQAFGAWMATLFAEQGLVLHDALSTGLKPHLRDAYARAVKGREQILQVLKRRLEEISQAGLSSQVVLRDDETFLFLLEGDSRFKLEFESGRYRVRNGHGLEMDPAELALWLTQHAESVGPNVLLRPILQDQLFPTAAYVGGPAEVAYFAQVNAIAGFWDVEPAIFPRVGVTLVDAKAQRLLRKYRLHIRDIIGVSPDLTVERLVRDSEGTDIVQRFDSWESSLKSEAEALRRRIDEIDPTVAGLLGNSEAKMVYQVNKVRDRFVRNFARHASDLERHVRFLHNSLYPEQKLQERSLGFAHFLILYGPTLVKDLLNSVQPFCKEHQVLYVPSR